jgi:sugar lactone lactonase YvrE
MISKHPTLCSRFSLVLALGIAGLLGGCDAPPQTVAEKVTYYPAPPLPPRLQFLTSYSGAQDLGGGPSKFATFVVGKEPLQKPILKPYGIAARGDKIYLADTAAGAIDIIDLKTRDMRYFTSSGDGRLVTPTNIAVDEDGTMYVADPARGQIVIFGKDESYKGAIGERLNGPARAHSAQLPTTTIAPVAPDDEMKPTDVAVNGDRLYITDLKKHCVRVFSKSERIELFTIPRAPATADAKSRLYTPTNITIDQRGQVYVSDLGAFRVLQYSADGQFLNQFGQGSGDRPGEFSRPKGVAVDREGRLYIVDAATQVVQIFDAERQLLLYFGEMQGDHSGLELPAKVAIDYEHVGLFASYAAPDFQVEYLVLVTSQIGERKLSVFGYGHKK